MLPRFLTLFTTSALMTITVVSGWVSANTPMPDTLVADGLRVVVDEAPAPVPEWTRICGRNADADLDRLIEQVSADYDIEPAMLAAVVKKESTCRPDAIGRAGEIGLTQIHPKVWTEYFQDKGLIIDASNLLDPETNLRCAAHILSGHLKKTDGNVWKSFRKYNGRGPKARRYANDAYSIYESL